jgi:hypothetical protein
MPLAMIVAARTHGPEEGAQGAGAFPVRMTPSSHGGLPMFAKLRSFRTTPTGLPAL